MVFGTQGTTAEWFRSTTGSIAVKPLQLTRFSEHRARMSVCYCLVIDIFAVSGKSVPALHSVLATGLSSRHRSELGTFEHCRFAGLRRPVTRAILGAKVLAKRALEELFARGTSKWLRRTFEQPVSCFRARARHVPAAHELLPSSSRATAHEPACELLPSSSRAFEQSASYLPAGLEILVGFRV